MPPRPPLTSLVIHTWKEHGKPRPFSNQNNSATAAKARISRSISHDAHLARRLNQNEHRRSNYSLGTARSVSYEDGLTTVSNMLTRDVRSSRQQRGTATGTTEDHHDGMNSDDSKVNITPPTLVDFSPVRINCLPNIPELEWLSPPASSGINASKLVRSTQASQKKKRKVKLHRPAHPKEGKESQLRTHASLLERSCSFDADLSTIAEKSLEMSCGIAPNL